jgi:hypothetical protein
MQASFLALLSGLIHQSLTFRLFYSLCLCTIGYMGFVLDTGLSNPSPVPPNKQKQTPSILSAVDIGVGEIVVVNIASNNSL